MNFWMLDSKHSADPVFPCFSLPVWGEQGLLDGGRAQRLVPRPPRPRLHRPQRVLPSQGHHDPQVTILHRQFVVSSLLDK